MENYQIKDDGPVSYFSMIPHLVDDASLSAFAYRMYGHLKRVTGENGKCWQSQATLEKACQMSNRTVVKAKRELIKAGFITVTLDIVSGHPGHIITIVDLWKQNENVYRCKSAPDVSSIGVEQHPKSIENNTPKNNHISIPNNLSGDSSDILKIWYSVRGFSALSQAAVELVFKLREEFPEIDILAESKSWMARKLSEPLTSRSKPLGQIWNWMRKAEEFRKERGNGKSRGYTQETGARRLKASVGAPIKG